MKFVQLRKIKIRPKMDFFFYRKNLQRSGQFLEEKSQRKALEVEISRREGKKKKKTRH